MRTSRAELTADNRRVLGSATVVRLPWQPASYRDLDLHSQACNTWESTLSTSENLDPEEGLFVEGLREYFVFVGGGTK